MSPVTRRRAIGLAVAAAIFLIDQFIKWHMIYTLRLREAVWIELMPFFDLHWTPNYGVSLGLLKADTMEMRLLLIALTAAIALFVLIWMLREKAMADILALALILGGAIGNIRDRMEYGFVVDYIDIHFWGWTPFVFNVADAAITFGVVIILARSLLSREKPETAPETAPES